MKKSKIKMLTAAACLALVGTASAAWVYAGTATASANIGVKVAAYASAGTITVNNADNVCVYLDNGSVSYKLADESKTFSAKYNEPTDVTDKSGKSVNRYFTVVISKALADYVTFKDVNYATTSGDGSVHYDLSKVVAGGGSTLNWTDNGDLLDELPALAWKENKCPDDENGYIELINSLCGENTVTSLDETNKNSEWNVTEKNSECYVSIQLYAAVN